MYSYDPPSAERVAALYVDAAMHREALRAKEMLKWVVQPLKFLTTHHKDFINGPVDDVMDEAFREITPHLVKSIGEREIDADVDEYHEGAVRGKWDKERDLHHDPPRRETEDFREGYEWGFAHPEQVSTKDLPPHVKKRVVEEAIREFKDKVTEKVVLKALRSTWHRVNPVESFKAIIKAVKKHGWKLGLFIACVEIMETFVMPAVLIYLTGNAALAITGQLPLSEILYAIIFPIMFRGQAADAFSPDGHLDWYEAQFGLVRVGGMTAQARKLKEVQDDFTHAVGNLSSALRPQYWSGIQEVPEGNRSDLMQDIKQSAAKLHPLLEYHFDNPNTAAGYKKYLNRMKRYRKMVRGFRDASGWEALVAHHESLATKSKNPWQKLHEYGNEALGVLHTVDSEVEGTFAVGKFRVILQSTTQGDWDAEMIDRTRFILAKTTQLLSKHGLGKVAAGNVWAYSSPTIPGRGRVLAWYRMADDALCIAAGSGWWAKRSLNDILKTLIHELGHRAYFRVLGSRGRKAWEEFFEMSQAAPDVAQMIRGWEKFVQGAGTDLDEFRREHLQRYLPVLEKKDPIQAKWLRIVTQNFQLNGAEKYDSYRGYPTKTSVSTLQSLRDKASQIKVFMYPVTVYSASEAAELFAEVFAHYIVYGPQTVAPIVQDQFKRALPMAKLGKERIPGGLSEGKDRSEYDSKEMAMGIKVEMEHTEDPEVAKEIAADHLEEIPDYYTRLKKMEQEAETSHKEADAKNGKTTGDRSSVGFFIPLPDELAKQYPSRAPDDKSPSHVTLLYVGSVPAARQQEFSDVVGDVLNREHGPIKARIGEVDYFRHPDKNRTIAIQSIQFSQDVAEIRDRLRGALEDAGFEVQDSFPGAYRSHTTLAYLDGVDAVYEGVVPKGSWEFNIIPAWGFPTAMEFQLGTLTDPSPITRNASLEELWGSTLPRGA